MRKALGLLACTTFAAAGIWSVIPGSATRHVSAEQPNSGNASRSVTPVSDSRSTTLGRLNPFTRSTSNKNSKDGYRQAATQLLDDAKDLAARGDVAGARRLAERAQSFPIDWAPNERSPENFLAQLDADSKGRSKPSSKPATAIAKRPAAPQSGNGNSLANLETLTNGKPARNSIAPVIAQASNEESFDESADEPLEEVVTPTKQSAPAGTQPASGKLSAAKELMQQSRSELAKGNFDAARAKADQARGMNVAYGVFDERPEQILAQIDRLENNNHESAPRTQNLAQSAKKTAPAKRVAANFNDSPFDEEAPARPTTVAKTSPSAPEQKQTQDDEHESAPRTQTLAQSSKKTAPAKRVAANFDDSPFDAEAPARPATVAKTSRPAPAQKQIQDDDVPFDEPAPSRNQAAQKISPKSGSPFVQSLVGDDAPETADPADAGELAPTNNDQQLSQQLLSQSQSAINKGNLEQARTLALQAQELDVAYGLFDLRPDHVIAKIDRASNNLTIAKNGTKAKDAAKQLANSKPLTNLQPQRKELPTEEVDSPFAKLATSARDLGQDVAEDKATVKVRQQAMTALQQARQEMQAGRLDAARQKVLAVQKLNATYGLWDDRPEALLEEIGRVELAQKSTPTPKTSPDQSKARALTLMKQARADLAAGRVDAAKQKAEQAEAMNVAFEVFEDRPDLVLNAIQRVSHKSIDVPPEPEEGVELLPIRPAPIANRIAPKGLPETPDSSMPRQATRSNPVVMQTELESVPPADDVSEEPAVVAIHPEGPSAEQLFREGQIHLNTGNKGAAYQAFLKAYQSGQKLDARRGQQLQDYLRELSPRRNKSIQLAGNQVGTQLSADNESDLNGPAEPRELDLQRPLDIASSRQKVQLDKLRNEVLNTIYRAERLKDQKEPTKALEALDHTMANIESSGLDKSLTASLSSTLLKSRVSIESNQKLQEPNLIQKAENDDVKQTIARVRNNKVRTEREFAKLVQQFNELMDQKRYSEAEVIAKQAKDLDSDNPVSETLVYKSQLARRVDSNDRLKSDKEAGFWDTLNSVELSGIPFNDMKSVEFGKDWNDIKKRRSGGKYGTDNRIRSPEEQRIESNLSRPISLHFENAPLKKVIEHLATIADINVMLDTAGLEEESLSVSTPVSINVDSIKMKSALNLLLEPLNLGYTIKHEVLQITSGTRLQGQLVPVTYSVADLVVTIQPTQSSSPFANINGTGPMGGSGFAGGQMSVSPTGGSQGGQFQVAGAQTAPSVTPWLASSSPQWQQAPHNNGHDFRELIDLITTTCEPSSWLEVGGGGHCKGNDSTLSLVIRQTQKVHDEIRDLLEQLRRLQDLQVTIEVRFISVSDTFFERIGIDFSFDVQDNLGGPNLINSTGGGGQQGGGGQGGQQGQGGGLSPIPPFGSIISGGQQQGQQGQQGGQQGQQGQQGGQAGGGNFFTPGPSRQHTDRDSYKKGGSILGLSSSNSFTQDQDIAFRQGSFAVGVPDFGRFDANAGLNVGFAILSDIETFFFINAAQGDRRSNIMSAPKVTLFNGQNASVFDGQQRPFVTSLIPVVGAFAVGYQPQLTVVPDGVGMSVTAVISADRRFVRLQITPFIQQIVDIVAFSFVSAGGGGGGGGQQGGGGQGGGGQGGGGQGGGQFGQGGIGGGPAMESGGLYNHGMFGRAMGGSEDYANLAQSGFGGIGGAGGLHVLESTLLSQGQQGGGQQGGGQQGGGQQGGGQQGGGVQAAGAGTVSVQLPVVASTNVGTVVSVPDGGTVLLGGVKRLRESRNMAGVPILNKIPYISRLFKNTGVGRETSSLMLMVTPRIVILEEEEGLLGIPN